MTTNVGNERDDDLRRVLAAQTVPDTDPAFVRGVSRRLARRRLAARTLGVCAGLTVVGTAVAIAPLASVGLAWVAAALVPGDPAGASAVASALGTAAAVVVGALGLVEITSG